MTYKWQSLEWGHVTKSNYKHHFNLAKLKSKDITPVKSLKIVGLGDSITAGTDYLTPHLETYLKDSFGDENITVVNSGISGDTSIGGLARLQNDVLNHNPDIVLIEFGTNDAYGPLAIETYRVNMRQIMQQVKDIGAIPILWTVPPEYPPNYAKVVPYNDVAKEEAGSLEVQIVDIYSIVDNGLSVYDFITTDGIHPHEQGRIAIAKIMFSSIYNTVIGVLLRN